MVETLTEGSGSGKGIDDLTSVGGDPDPFWSEEEHKALLNELADIDRKIKAAPKAGEHIWREITVIYAEPEKIPRIEMGPYKRLGSVALNLN